MDRDPSVVERTAAVVPAYNAAPHLAAVIARVEPHIARARIIVVDDGSTDDTRAIAEAEGIDLVVHPHNLGKGAALRNGMARAEEIGCEFGITLDADEQHNPDDIPAFLNRWVETGAEVIVGNRLADPKDMPRIRLWTNYFTSWVVSRRAGQRIPDSQNGYRMMSTKLFNRLDLVHDRYEAESEILIKAGRAGAKIESVPVETIYGEEVSSINPVVDTARFFRMVLKSFFW